MENLNLFKENNLLNNYQLFNTDAIEFMQFNLDDESIDLIYCDILYNTGKKFRDYHRKQS